MERFGYTHLSTGDLLREELKKDTDRARMMSDIMKDGKLVPQVNVTIVIESVFHIHLRLSVQFSLRI